MYVCLCHPACVCVPMMSVFSVSSTEGGVVAGVSACVAAPASASQSDWDSERRG